MALAHPRTRYAKSGELAIAYQMLGDGPQGLILIPPGLSVMDAAWDEPALASFWRRLSSFTRLVVIDKRGKPGYPIAWRVCQHSKIGWTTCER